MEINGMRVVDATRSVTLHISQDDTKKGNTKDPGACAAARSCLREVKDCEAARIHLGRAYLKVGKKWLRFKTSEALRSEIVAFDRGGTFEPGEYILRPMPPSGGLTKKAAGGYGDNPNRPNRLKKPRKLRVMRAKPHQTTNVRSRGANR